MHIGDSPEEAAFRAEARAWLDVHAPAHRATGGGFTHHDLPRHVAAIRTWQRVLSDHGWAGITWPTKYGGRGGSAIEAAIFNEEQARAGVSNGSFSVAIGMAAPTLMAHGTDAQRDRYLAPMLRGDELWCQLFSEPGAGSDLASLGTRAVRDGDEWVVNGQKVWTSLGQFAEYGILIARTHPELPKHKGITYFIVDMRSPGIEVRPLRQINGSEHFNEVFLTDVRIAHENVVGEPGEGWKVAHTTMANERNVIGGASGSWTAEQMIDLARRRGLSADPVVRQQLAGVITRTRLMQYLGYRLRTAMSHRRMPGAEALIMKLAFADHQAASTSVAMSILGADGMLADRPGDIMWAGALVSQFAVRIGGGTDEMQRNIIAEQGLGLPREQHNDKDTPWKDLRKA